MFTNKKARCRAIAPAAARLHCVALLNNNDIVQHTHFTCIISSAAIDVTFCPEYQSCLNRISMYVINFFVNYFVAP